MKKPSRVVSMNPEVQTLFSRAEKYLKEILSANKMILISFRTGVFGNRTEYTAQINVGLHDNYVLDETVNRTLLNRQSDIKKHVVEAFSMAGIDNATINFTIGTNTRGAMGRLIVSFVNYERPKYDVKEQLIPVLNYLGLSLKTIEEDEDGKYAIGVSPINPSSLVENQYRINKMVNLVTLNRESYVYNYDLTDGEGYLLSKASVEAKLISLLTSNSVMFNIGWKNNVVDMLYRHDIIIKGLRKEGFTPIFDLAAENPEEFSLGLSDYSILLSDMGRLLEGRDFKIEIENAPTMFLNMKGIAENSVSSAKDKDKATTETKKKKLTKVLSEKEALEETLESFKRSFVKAGLELSQVDEFTITRATINPISYLIKFNYELDGTNEEITRTSSEVTNVRAILYDIAAEVEARTKYTGTHFVALKASLQSSKSRKYIPVYFTIKELIREIEVEPEEVKKEEPKTLVLAPTPPTPVIEKEPVVKVHLIDLMEKLNNLDLNEGKILFSRMSTLGIYFTGYSVKGDIVTFQTASRKNKATIAAVKEIITHGFKMLKGFTPYFQFDKPEKFTEAQVFLETIKGYMSHNGIALETDSFTEAGIEIVLPTKSSKEDLELVNSICKQINTTSYTIETKKEEVMKTLAIKGMVPNTPAKVLTITVEAGDIRDATNGRDTDKLAAFLQPIFDMGKNVMPDGFIRVLVHDAQKEVQKEVDAKTLAMFHNFRVVDVEVNKGNRGVLNVFTELEADAKTIAAVTGDYERSGIKDMFESITFIDLSAAKNPLQNRIEEVKEEVEVPVKQVTQLSLESCWKDFAIINVSVNEDCEVCWTMEKGEGFVDPSIEDITALTAELNKVKEELGVTINEIWDVLSLAKPGRFFEFVKALNEMGETLRKLTGR